MQGISGAVLLLLLLLSNKKEDVNIVIVSMCEAVGKAP